MGYLKLPVWKQTMANAVNSEKQDSVLVVHLLLRGVDEHGRASSNGHSTKRYDFGGFPR
jgi:hypothetical protein